MCGRYALHVLTPELAELLRALSLTVQLGPRYNITPTQSAPILRLGDDGLRELVMAKWGLIPSWAKDAAIGNRMINARAETAAEKPAFRAAMKKRRCIVPASGFYEWQKIEGSKVKQPWHIHSADAPIIGMAGLWERWRGPTDSGDTSIDSFTILTTTPNALMKRLHDRMPVILSPDEYEAWLDPDSAPDHVASLLDPAPDGTLVAHTVSTRVNSPHNDDQSLVSPNSPSTTC